MDKEVCCPPFDASLWEEKTLEWQGKRFIKGQVFTLFYMPMNFGSVIRRLDGMIRKAGGTIPDNLCLSDHRSKWRMDLYLAVDKEIPGAENAMLSGRFLSKVYEGPYKDTGKWCEDFKAYTQTKGLEIKKWYMWYTTCPKCAKEHGKNFVAVVAEVE